MTIERFFCERETLSTGPNQCEHQCAPCAIAVAQANVDPAPLAWPPELVQQEQP